MMVHDVGAGRGGTEAALGAITARTLVVDVDSDRLFLPGQAEQLARAVGDEAAEKIRAALRDAGHGVDVASFNELRQVIDRGVLGERIIVSAAIKTDELLRLAIDHGAVISADNVDEYERIARLERMAGPYR